MGKIFTIFNLSFDLLQIMLHPCKFCMSLLLKALWLYGIKVYNFYLIPGFGRKDVVEHLLECGASVHAKDDGGLIPLHNACSFGHAEVVQLLLRSGADANARDNWNYTPLHEAAIKGKIDVCIGECLFWCQSLYVNWKRLLGNMTNNLILTFFFDFVELKSGRSGLHSKSFAKKVMKIQKTWFCKHLKYGLKYQMTRLQPCKYCQLRLFYYRKNKQVWFMIMLNKRRVQ